MNNSQQIVPFDFNGRQVNVIIKNGEPLFRAEEVCRILKHTHTRRAIIKHVFSEDVTQVSRPTAGGVQKVNYINESGLYALIFGSRLQSARQFKNWVTREVLPSIRKTGSFGAEGVKAEILGLKLELQRAKRAAAENKLEGVKNSRYGKMNKWKYNAAELMLSHGIDFWQIKESLDLRIADVHRINIEKGKIKKADSEISALNNQLELEGGSHAKRLN